MKAKYNYEDLNPHTKDIFTKLGFKPVSNAKVPTYEKYGVWYRPAYNGSRLKRYKRVEPAKEEIVYFGKTYVLSRVAARIMNMSTANAITKLKKLQIDTLEIDSMIYWNKRDVQRAKKGKLYKIDPYAFLDKMNQTCFSLNQTEDGLMLTSYDNKVEIKINLTMRLGKQKNIIKRIPVDEKFKHMKRGKKKTGQHYLIGDRGTVINISLQHLIQPILNEKGYLAVTINGENGKLHRWVALTWISNKKHKPFVHHIDRNKLNNRVENLLWVTKAEHDECHRLLKEVDRATDRSSHMKAKKKYMRYVYSLR